MPCHVCGGGGLGLCRVTIGIDKVDERCISMAGNVTRIQNGMILVSGSVCPVIVGNHARGMVK